MSSILKVDTIQDTSGNNIINENAGTVTIGKSGDTVNVVGTLQNGGTNFLQGITEADQFRLTANLTSNADPISANLERVDNATFAKIGTGMSLSSGIYTFPTTGLYQVIFTMRSLSSASDTITGVTYVSSNSGSSYDAVAHTVNGDGGSSRVNQGNSIAFVNVTNTSTFRIKFAAESLVTGSMEGNTAWNETCFTFIRLGDSQ